MNGWMKLPTFTTSIHRHASWEWLNARGEHTFFFPRNSSRWKHNFKHISKLCFIDISQNIAWVLHKSLVGTQLVKLQMHWLQLFVPWLWRLLFTSFCVRCTGKVPRYPAVCYNAIRAVFSTQTLSVCTRSGCSALFSHSLPAGAMVGGPKSCFSFCWGPELEL